MLFKKFRKHTEEELNILKTRVYRLETSVKQLECNHEEVEFLTYKRSYIYQQPEKMCKFCHKLLKTYKDENELEKDKAKHMKEKGNKMIREAQKTLEELDDNKNVRL